MLRDIVSRGTAVNGDFMSSTLDGSKLSSRVASSVLSLCRNCVGIVADITAMHQPLVPTSPPPLSALLHTSRRKALIMTCHPPQNCSKALNFGDNLRGHCSYFLCNCYHPHSQSNHSAHRPLKATAPPRPAPLFYSAYIGDD